MTPAKALHLLRTRECRWTTDHHALLFGGEHWTGTAAVRYKPDPVLQEIEKLAVTTGLMDKLAEHDGDVPAMLAALSEDDRRDLAAAVATIRTRHSAAPEVPACL